jgi:hypothetical protein
MRAVFFDIETRMPPEDWDRRERIGITCAAALRTLDNGGEVTKLWYAGMSQIERMARTSPSWTVDKVEGGLYPVTDEMSDEEVEMMLDELLALTHGDKVLDGFGGQVMALFSWNGVGFDYPIIAANLPQRHDEIVQLCNESFDPCFQAMRTYGWPIGLEKTAMAMLGSEKAEGMDGSLAAETWPMAIDVESGPNAAKVLRYVKGDVRLLRDVVFAIQQEKAIRWINSKGGESRKPIDPPHNANPRWVKVRSLIERTYGEDRSGNPITEPNRSWMDDPDAFTLQSTVGWMKREEVT